jgi:16S rRNA processing protein RimM
MTLFDSWVLLARLVRPQGRKGEAIAEIFTDFPDRFAAQPRVFLSNPAKPAEEAREALVERHWLHQGRIVFKFKGIDTMNDAETLRGLEVVIPASERTPLAGDAVYIGDLIGCRVIDLNAPVASDAEAGRVVGEIVDVERSLGGAPDLLVVRAAPTLASHPNAQRPCVGAPGSPGRGNPGTAAENVPGPDKRPRRGRRTKDAPELLIPFAKLYLVSIDLAGQRVTMRLPPGLTELNAVDIEREPD